jgi:hypothetical protein
MTRMLSLATFLLPLATAACGTTEAAPSQPQSPPKAQRASSDADFMQLCTEVFTRNRTCTDTYIPALVDARAKYDQPPGIAEKVRSDRDGVIAKAKEEWAVDSTDESIQTVCSRIVANLSDDDRADMPKARECLALTDCSAYTTCIMPQFEKRFAK